MQVSKFVERALSYPNAARFGGSVTLDELPEEERPKKRRCTLFVGDASQPNRFSANVSTTVRLTNRAENVRHRHDFDQLRMTVTGNPEWGPGHWAPEGWIHYTPAGTFYGPSHQTDLEGFETFTVRFEGADGPVADVVSTEASDAEIDAARDRLVRKGGSFEDGVYTWVDDDGTRHQRDGYEACNEEAFGKPIQYPSARYATPILIDPGSFSWLESAPGVRKKELGRFTERETRFELIRLDGDVSHALAAGEQRTLLFVTDGSGAADGQPISKRDGVLLERGEEAELSTDGHLELFLLAMPKCIPA